MDIEVTTYCLITLKIPVFRLNFHLCLYVSIWLYIYIQYIGTCCRWWLRAMWVAPEDGNPASMKMHLAAMINHVLRYTRRSWLHQYEDAIGGHDHVNYKFVIWPGWKYTWRPRLSTFEDILGGYDYENFEAIIRYTWRRSWRWLIGRCHGFWDSIHPLGNSMLCECDEWTVQQSFHIVLGQ